MLNLFQPGGTLNGETMTVAAAKRALMDGKVVRFDDISGMKGAQYTTVSGGIDHERYVLVVNQNLGHVLVTAAKKIGPM